VSAARRAKVLGMRRDTVGRSTCQKKMLLGARGRWGKSGLPEKRKKSKEKRAGRFRPKEGEKGSAGLERQRPGGFFRRGKQL